MRIDIILQANFWNKSPSISIKLDNKIIENITNFVDKQKTNISFDVDVKEGEHELAIERQNKTTKDTLLKNSKIIKDSTIDILDIVIDEISIEPLLDKAKFFPQYPEPWLSQQKQIGKEPPVAHDYCRTLHHNGKWKLNFANPVHVWFFQNINVQI
jgi:hypothetical protein|tara:strand:+ start:298 stop:765 length:468 start_codon:yes stop_codon:yes gene_type:complete